MLKFETETTITGSCKNCPLREDCDQLTQYTICELLNIPGDLAIKKVIETDEDEDSRSFYRRMSGNDVNNS